MTQALRKRYIGSVRSRKPRQIKLPTLAMKNLKHIWRTCLHRLTLEVSWCQQYTKATLAALITGSGDNAVAQFFPTEIQQVPSTPKHSDASDEIVEEKARHILAQAVKPSNSRTTSDGREKFSETSYEAFRTVEDLSHMAHAFYKATGWCICSYIHDCVFAVH